nr:phosphoribosylformylglycinamidine synthase [Clostridia bacterium]
MVYRVYVERKAGFNNEAKSTLSDLNVNLEAGLKGVRYLNRYDVEGIDEKVFDTAKVTIFSEPQSDTTADKLTVGENDRVLIVEYLPGQFDQRADSCAQCVQLLTRGDRPIVRTARIYVFEGEISDEMFEKIKKYIINPVESRETDDTMPASLDDNFAVPEDVAIVEGFIGADDAKLGEIMKQFGFAMDMDDLRFCQAYFRDEEKRDPSVTELRMIDTYWSDHCRHTTFLTEISDVKLDSPYVKAAYDRYLNIREKVYVDRVKPITLMDIATVGAKYLKKTGIMKNLDESDEINACSVKIEAEIDGNMQDWLLMFKNETHNHPTEIEPFGGAATCLGGAIRDPLSGRAYVYQAMRVTGAADPRLPVSETLEGKLPQSKLTQGAAAGYSSYGNQIGLATGGVYELYHPGYVAKRLEIGAVVGAAPEANVVRLEPAPGDKIVLLGGRTGRDGCGGATGSSKSHTLESITTCGAEVQKGNPPEERKIQRLFRNPEVTAMIKRCNDFGAGGVSVAVGELADGLKIDLDKVPKKYEGLDGTELAVSESQERMAVVVRAEDAERFIAEASKENLEATVVAEVTEEKRLTMSWRGVKTVDLSREFLNSNGAKKYTDIEVSKGGKLYAGIDAAINASDVKSGFEALLGDLNVCCQKGLSERFDSSIGASTVVMPFGGKHQLTPPQYMAAKLPLDSGDTATASYMAYGFDPYLSSSDPYAGALYAVTESLARLVAAGIDYKTAYLSLQEYFERTKGDPKRWGKPFAALLGALTAQLEFGVGAIGGKDSMSGTFENLDVPPTLVSFAVAASRADKAVTPEFKAAGNKVWYLEPKYTADGLPKFDSFRKMFDNIHALTESGTAKSVWALGHGGIGEAIFKMSVGNGIGFKSVCNMSNKELFSIKPGAFVVETAADIEVTAEGAKLIGYTTSDCSIVVNGEAVCLCGLRDTWLKPLEGVFPLNPKSAPDKEMVDVPLCTTRSAAVYTGK